VRDKRISCTFWGGRDVEAADGEKVPPRRLLREHAQCAGSKQGVASI
jgi:hypothetical protein